MESKVDIQNVIKIGNDKDENTIPVEVIESVKEQRGAVSVSTIKDYISSRAFNSLCRNGFLDIGSIIYAIEENRLAGKSGMGRGAMREIIELFSQMNLIERKDDQVYKPLEGYISKIALADNDNVEED